MASTISFIDGYKGRPVYGQGSWPGGSSYEVPGGMGGKTGQQHVLIGEGRFGGNAGGADYNSWFGEYSYFGNNDLRTLYKWFQCGYWVSYTSRQFIGSNLIAAISPKYLTYGVRGQASMTGVNTGIMWSIDNNTNQLKWGSTLSGSVVPNVELNKWYWVEYRAYLDSSAGIGEVYIDNYYHARFTNQNTGAGSGWNGWQHGYQASYNYITGVRWDSLYVVFADSEGELPPFGKKWSEPAEVDIGGSWSDYVNDEREIRGEAWNNLTGLPADDNNYVTVSGSSGTSYIIDLDDLKSTWSNTVYGVKHTIRARKTNAYPLAIRPFCVISSTKYYGGTFYLSGEYREYFAAWRLNPSTSGSWTRTAINGASFGFEVV